MLLRVLNPTCDECGRTHELIAEFAQTFRDLEKMHNRRPPGNLCGGCTGTYTSKRLIHEAETAFGVPHEEENKIRH